LTYFCSIIRLVGDPVQRLLPISVGLPWIDAGCEKKPHDPEMAVIDRVQ
jgi:hypothetical protein